MKILLFTPHYPPIIGGAEVFSEALANYLPRRGVEVHVVTGRIDRLLEKRKDDPRIHFHRVSLVPMKDLINPSNFYLSTGLPLMCMKSISLVKKEQINIIHTVGVLAAMLGAVISGMTARPMVATIQGHKISNYSNGGFNPFHRWIRYSLSKSSLVHCISESIEESVRGLGAKRTLLVPNGIYLNKAWTDRTELKKQLGRGEEKIILAAGRLIEIKGVRYLIEAMPRIVEQWRDCRLIIVGDGPEKSKLITLANELGLGEKVDFVGSMPQERLFAFMGVSDVFVGPSLFEGLGNVFIEAMNCGTPVIGTRVGGIPDIIDDGVNGLLVPPRDSDSIAGAVTTILKDGELASRLSRNGLKTVEERFDWNRICERIYEGYEQMCT